MKVLVIDDDQTLRDLFARELSRTGHQVATAATAAEGLARSADGPDVVLLDLMLPDQSGIDVLRKLRADRPGVEVVVLTAHGTVDTAISAMKLGAFDYLQKPCHLQELELTLQRACEHKALAADNARLREGLASVGGEGGELAGCGAAFQEQMRFVSKVAQSNSAVLLRGETGVGKELMARTIHRLSSRRDQPFVVLDCASINESLLQSELFGHEKGAFTGASRLKYGLFEVANCGTAFLDEIGDVSPAVQAGFLRVLETSAFRRLGGTCEVKVDVRLIAATNRNLEKMMRAGQFRQDLYFRLNTISVGIAPVRDRREEIPFLVDHFVSRHNARCGGRRSVTPEAMAILAAHDWPGNVRELRHVVERALAVAEQEAIGPCDLPPEMRRKAPAPLPAPTGGATTLAELEARHIAQVLAEVGGHRARAAQVLGISQRSLYRRIEELGLDGPDPS